MKSVALLLLLLATAPQRPEIAIPDLERRVHTLVNAERRTAKLNSLELDERLGKIARQHSADMATRNFFSHVNPDGQDLAERARAGGHVCQKRAEDAAGLGENIYYGTLYKSSFTRGKVTTYDWKDAETIAAESVKAWMASEGHRQNMLQKDYTMTGMGIAFSADFKVYVTQVFC